MKVLFLTPHPEEGASTRYRVKQFFPYLNSHGVECIFRPFLSSDCFNILYKEGGTLQKGLNLLKGIFQRTLNFINSGNIDIVFIHLEASPMGLPIFEKLFAYSNKPIIYDLDDALYIKKVSPANRWAYFLKSSSKIPAIIRISKHVITCNEYLERYVKRFNEQVTVIPTSVDTGKFTLKDYNITKKEVVIGWIGSHTTSVFLSDLSGAFSKLAKRYKFVLKIIGSQRRDYFPDIDTVYSDWSLAREAFDFQDLDIGVYPLPDNEWVKGKTGFKTVQYMSVGVPCVVSKVGRNIDIVEDGVNGFLASSEDEWVDRLSLLIENPQLRQRIGFAGRKTVEEKFSLKANAPKILEIIQKVYSKEGKR